VVGGVGGDGGVLPGRAAKLETRTGWLSPAPPSPSHLTTDSLASIQKEAIMASSGFLRLGDIKGESQDSGPPSHVDDIEFLSFSWGATNPASSGGGGQVNINDFTIVKNTDLSSPILFQKCCTGEKIDSAIVTLRAATGQFVEFLVITLNDVYITSYQTSGQADGSLPMESISLSFDKCHMTYNNPDPTAPAQGPTDGGYDLDAGAPA
jgi:type VI secretion system secreted protein Hcp